MHAYYSHTQNCTVFYLSSWFTQELRPCWVDWVESVAIICVTLFCCLIGMGGSCIVCGKKKSLRHKISLHRLPKKHEVRTKWLNGLSLAEADVTENSRVCSMHFRDGNPSNVPSCSIGAKFAAQPVVNSERSTRAQKRKAIVTLPTPPASKKTCSNTESETDQPPTTLVATPDKTLAERRGSQGLYSEVDLSCISSASENLSEATSLSFTPCSSMRSLSPTNSTPGGTDVTTTVNVALVARIQFLEAQNNALRQQLSHTRKGFRIEQIANDDSLVSLYTGFPSYEVLLSFFEFLGPAAHNLHYHGSKSKGKRRRKTKLDDPLNQFFLTLVKLKLDLNMVDMAFRFGISSTSVSRYFITWISFLYHQLNELNWYPSTEQVKGTMPTVFRDKYPSTVAIIDASEIFIETPSDLVLQSSSWSNYKHHNTAKFLVACTPNGAICFISPVYLGSISDPELTKVSGFLEKVSPGVSIMADRGFTIKDLLSAIGADLNLPPFLRGKKQLSADEVAEGRSIASLRIHVERAIGRMKHFQILTGTVRLKMARVLDQIVTVCAYLSNFHPALVPKPNEDLSELPTSTPPVCTSSTSKSVEQSVDTTYTVSSDAPFSLSELNLSSNSEQNHSFSSDSM